MQGYLNDFRNWSNADFGKASNQPNYAKLYNSWVDQRAFVTNAVLALNSSAKYAPLAKQMQDSLAALRPPSPPDPSSEGYTSIPKYVVDCPRGLRPPLTAYLQLDARNSWAQNFTCGNLLIGFDPQTGSVASLYDKVTGTSWITPNVCLSCCR